MFTEGTVPVTPRTAPVLAVLLYYLLWSYRSMGCRMGGRGALHAKER